MNSVIMITLPNGEEIFIRAHYSDDSNVNDIARSSVLELLDKLPVGSLSRDPQVVNRDRN